MSSKSIKDLPIEILEHILSFCFCYEDVIALRLTCKTLYDRLATSQNIWKKICKKLNPEATPEVRHSNWYGEFQRHVNTLETIKSGRMENVEDAACFEQDPAETLNP